MLKASVDLSDVDRALTRMRSAGLNMRPAFAAMRKPMRTDQRDHARQAEGPEGKWPKRAESTRKRLRGRGKRLLGRIPSAIVVKVAPRGIYVESRVKWSEIHQSGGRAGHGANIPARPFLWISDRMMETAVDLIEQRLEEAF